MELGAIIGAVVGIGSSLFGASAQQSANDAARRDAEALVEWENQTSQQNYEYALDIRDYEYDQQLRIWEKSLDVYNQQVSFNSEAAFRSYESEMRKMDEYLIGMSFQKQAMLVDQLNERGQAELGAMGQSGRRVSNATLSQLGRNYAIMNQNLISANKQYNNKVESVGLQEKSANIEAYARLGLQPEKPPEPPKPLDKPAPGGSSVNPLLTIGNAAVSGVSGYQEYGGTFGY